MRQMGDSNMDQSIKDAENLYTVLELLYSCPIPLIARINGPAYGGGIGIIAACDIAFATTCTKFQFSEVRPTIQVTYVYVCVHLYTNTNICVHILHTNRHD
uniref:Delta(3,5)-Delta(2,4)-dienoyl-CoA isomerase, mitochondrial n=1 Tax=Lygus hesperus TaxID=30085 RepID=A0A0A9YH24_LYGHE